MSNFGPVIPVFVIALLLGIVGFLWYRRRSAQQSWSLFADRHGLTFVHGGFFGQYEMEGEYEGQRIRCYTETRGSGNNKTTYTVYVTALPDAVPFDLVAFEEHLFSDVVEMFGGQDIEVGDAKVDETFVFRSDRPAKVKSFFDDEDVMRAFRRLADSTRSAKIDHGAVQLEERNVQPDADELQRAFDELLAFVDELEAALAPDESQPATAARAGSAESLEDTSDSEAATTEDEKYAVEW